MFADFFSGFVQGAVETFCGVGFSLGPALGGVLYTVCKLIQLLILPTNLNSQTLVKMGSAQVCKKATRRRFF